MRIRQNKINTEPEFNLCAAIQPDGRGDRCIRFHAHEGMHHTFVAEWDEGSTRSRRRSPSRRVLQTTMSQVQPQTFERRLPVGRMRPYATAISAVS